MTSCRPNTNPCRFRRRRRFRLPGGTSFEGVAGLRSGHVAGYAVDAFDCEPPRVSELLKHPRVIATPHLGAFTTASVRNATQMAVNNLLAALDVL